MLILKYNDLTDYSSFTSKIFAKQQQEIKWIEAKPERMKALILLSPITCRLIVK